ncbi:MAG: macro domain-containing protein [Armatimonadota bacterium]|nr:macro domain-containing protein [Armatimonadota bacterium]
MSAYEIDGLTVEVAEGDITEADVEAIANAANNHLWMGAGVAGAIRRRGGEQVEREAVSKGPIEVGSAVETSAGDLPHRYVIHGAVMGQDLQTDAELIAQTTTSCLALADELGVSSLALPAFGTGVGGVDVTECAGAMLSAIEQFAGPQESLERVVLVLFGEDTWRAFDDVAKEALGE